MRSRSFHSCFVFLSLILFAGLALATPGPNERIDKTATGAPRRVEQPAEAPIVAYPYCPGGTSLEALARIAKTPALRALRIADLVGLLGYSELEAIELMDLAVDPRNLERVTLPAGTILPKMLGRRDGKAFADDDVVLKEERVVYRTFLSTGRPAIVAEACENWASIYGFHAAVTDMPDPVEEWGLVMEELPTTRSRPERTTKRTKSRRWYQKRPVQIVGVALVTGGAVYAVSRIGGGDGDMHDKLEPVDNVDVYPLK